MINKLIVLNSINYISTASKGAVLLSNQTSWGKAKLSGGRPGGEKVK